ncbi:MAG: hypothetical protein AAGJ46_01695 [Planctomycetota bacterium]
MLRRNANRKPQDAFSRSGRRTRRIESLERREMMAADVTEDLLADQSAIESIGPDTATFQTADPGSSVGDFNGDGLIDAADFTVLRDLAVSEGFDTEKYAAWRSNFGLTTEEALDRLTPRIELNSATVEENQAGSVIGQLALTGAPSGSAYAFSVSDDRFEIVNDALRLRDGVVLDHEDNSTIHLVVTAEGEGNLFEQQFTISVVDVNEAPTSIDLDSASVAANAERGASIGFASAVDPDSEDLLTYSLEEDADGRFAIDAQTGQITLEDASRVRQEVGIQHEITVRVVDAGGLIRDETFVISVTAPPGQAVINALTGDVEIHGTAGADLITVQQQGGDLVVRIESDLGESLTSFATASVGDVVVFAYEGDDSLELSVQGDLLPTFAIGAVLRIPAYALVAAGQPDSGERGFTYRFNAAGGMWSTRYQRERQSADGSRLRQAFDDGVLASEDYWGSDDSYLRTDWGADGAETRSIYEGDRLVQSQTWSPDGQSVRVTTDEDGSVLRQVFDGDTLIVEEAWETTGGSHRTTWESDGRVLREAFQGDQLVLYEEQTGAGDVLRSTWADDGSSVRQTFNGDALVLEEAWDAEGNSLSKTFVDGVQTTEEAWDAAGGYRITSWNADGTTTRDTFENETHVLHEAWDATGGFFRVAWNEDGSSIQQTYQDELLVLEEAWDAEGNALRKTFVDGVQTTEEAWDTAGGYRITSWNVDGTTVRDTFDQGTHVLHEAWDATGGFFRVAWNEDGSSIQQTFQDGVIALEEGFNASGDAIRKTYVNGIQTVEEAWAGPEGYRRTQWNADGSAVRETFQGEGLVLQEVWNADGGYTIGQFESEWNGVVGQINEWINWYNLEVDSLWEWYGETFASWESWYGGQVDYLWDWYSDQFGAWENWYDGEVAYLWSWYNDQFGAWENWLSDRIRYTYDEAANWLSSVGGGVSGFLEQVFSGFGLTGVDWISLPDWGSLPGWAQGWINDYIGDFNNGVDALYSSLQGYLGEAADQFSNGVDALYDSLQGYLDDAVREFNNGVDGLYDSLLGLLADAQSSYESARSQLEEQLGGLWSKWQSFADDLVDQFTSAVSIDLSDFGGIGEWLGGAWDGITDWASERWESFASWTSDRWNSFTDWSSDRWESFASWTSDRWESFTGWASDRWESIFPAEYVDLRTPWDQQDADKDGLLNGWEMYGIDFNGDGTIDLDLPALGADVNRKDLFVEIDAMLGRDPTAVTAAFDFDGDGAPDTVPAAVTAAGLATNTSLDWVIESFLNAPVSNPDGTMGIDLHLLIDDLTIALVAFPEGLDREDANGNGVIDTEDVNGNGVLDPGEDLNADGVLNTEDTNGTGALDGYADLRDDWFGTAAERADANWDNIRGAKELAFRYTMFADTHSGGGSSGLANTPGDNAIVTLGAFAPAGGTPLEQASTFMHEFGHNLGLTHGGLPDLVVNAGVTDGSTTVTGIDTAKIEVGMAVSGDSIPAGTQVATIVDETSITLTNGATASGNDNLRLRYVNLKPNYFSVMNYLWQFPTAGMAGWILDYSREVVDLDEGNLDEAAGVGFTSVAGGTQTMFGPGTAARPRTGTVVAAVGSVDWNSDGDTTDAGVSVDLNDDGVIGRLFGHNDWANLQLSVTAAKASAGSGHNHDHGCSCAACRGATQLAATETISHETTDAFVIDLADDQGAIESGIVAAGSRGPSDPLAFALATNSVSGSGAANNGDGSGRFVVHRGRTAEPRGSTLLTTATPLLDPALEENFNRVAFAEDDRAGWPAALDSVFAETLLEGASYSEGTLDEAFART